MAGTRKYGNEPSDSIKCGEIFDKQNQFASPQEGLCCIK